MGYENADPVKPINSLLVFSTLDLRRIYHGLNSHVNCIVRACTTGLHLSLKDILPAGSIFTVLAVNLTYLIVIAI